MRSMKNVLVLVGLVACGAAPLVGCSAGDVSTADAVTPPAGLQRFHNDGTPSLDELADPSRLDEAFAVTRVDVPGQTVTFFQVPLEDEAGGVGPSFIVRQEGHIAIPSFVDALQAQLDVQLDAPSLFDVLMQAPEVDGFAGVANGVGDTSSPPKEIDHAVDDKSAQALDQTLDAFLLPTIAGHHWVNTQISANGLVCDGMLGSPGSNNCPNNTVQGWACSGRTTGDMVYYGVPTLPKSCKFMDRNLLRVTAMNLPAFRDNPVGATSFIAQEDYGSDITKVMAHLPPTTVTPENYVVADWDTGSTPHRLGIEFTSVLSTEVIRMVTGNNIPN